MCNFVIRPIKSYATVDVKPHVKRGDVFEVKYTQNDSVFGDVGKMTDVQIPIAVFIHAFTASDEDMKKVKAEEAEWFKYK